MYFLSDLGPSSEVCILQKRCDLCMYITTLEVLSIYYLYWRVVVAFIFKLVLYVAAEATWEPINYGRFINQFLPDTIKIDAATRKDK